MNPLYEIVPAVGGESTIRHIVLGETIHPSGPSFEAQRVYVGQSLLASKLVAPVAAPLVLYDVGLGSGTNSAAALECYQDLLESGQKPRPLHIHSFENDLTLLEFAISHLDKFPHLAFVENILRELLRNQKYESENLKWEIHTENFVEKIKTDLPTAEIIFHDPYSPGKNPDMWGHQIFQRYSELISPQGCTLVTFSQATRIRASLLVCGFYVGVGDSYGFKRESTVASTTLSDLAHPLNTEWLKRWQNSHVPVPADLEERELEWFKSQLLGHAQFFDLQK